MGYVYLLKSEEFFKIGATKNNPQKRLKSLTTGNPNNIELIHYFKCEKYFKVEKALHRKYSHQRIDDSKEWFSLTQEQVDSFIQDCQSLCETLSFLYKENHFLKYSLRNQQFIFLEGGVIIFFPRYPHLFPPQKRIKQKNPNG